MRCGPDLKPMPGLADSWTVSPDVLVYTFKLFPKITFHDGKPLTSEDVVFTVIKVLTDTRARGTLLRIDKAEAPDPLTVVFTLKAPFAPFPNPFDCTTAPIVPKHIYGNTDFRKNPANAQAIGCGPFKLKEWVKGSRVHLFKHEGYYRAGEPHIDEIFYRVIPDAASRSVALEQGTVQLTQWTDVELFDGARLMVLLFSVQLNWLPAFGYVTIGVQQTAMERALDIGKHLLLRGLSLAAVYLAIYARLMRSSVIEVMHQDFIKTARAKGLKQGRIILRHVLRNAILPVVTVAGMQAGALVGGAVVVETVFAWPGLGRLIYDSVLQRDYPVMLGIFLVMSVIVVVLNFVTDVIYRMVDPRVTTNAS